MTELLTYLDIEVRQSYVGSKAEPVSRIIYTDPSRQARITRVLTVSQLTVYGFYSCRY